ncbi:MAG: succinate dehydrogenase/fumarate reductase iron-sulfur subunit [bacterium]
MDTVTLRVFRGDSSGGEMRDYAVSVLPGMVVLDAIHQIQQTKDSTLACRWNCKAAKCGSCSAEINGKPALMCKTRLDEATIDGVITVRPLFTFPEIKDLVTDVSWNYHISEKIPPFTPKPDAPKPFIMHQMDVMRQQEYRKCIECFLCQDVCHVLREHELKDNFYGPRQIVKLANYNMHPYDNLKRMDFIRNNMGIGYCNITKCCTDVCPEHIRITDNAIIPLKERVADKFFDPLRMLLVKLRILKNPEADRSQDSLLG